jgi:hypothetical protein
MFASISCYVLSKGIDGLETSTGLAAALENE